MAPLDGQGRISADSILRAAKTSKYKNVFFLGPFARRVSFASQQNRALNLVWALHALDFIAVDEEIAVVGAGLAGLTATAALLARGHRVSLYETKDEVLSRHIGASHRFIHPTINQWPERRIDETTTVPWFDWLSDDCSQLAKTLRLEWAELKNTYAEALSFKKRITVGGFGETRMGVGISSKSHDGAKPRIFYKAAIVTSGFADEDYGNKDAFPGYWDADDLDKKVDEAEIETFLVSGCGDGGLIDALRIAHKRFYKGILIVEVAKALQDTRPVWPHLKTIREAEEKLASSGLPLEKAVQEGSEALKLVYEAAAADLPTPILDSLSESLRIDRQIPFVTLMSRQSNPYSPMSAPIHKLLIAHAIDQQVVKHVQCNVEKWDKGCVTTAPVGAKPRDKQRRTPREGHVILRHGATPKFGVFFDEGEKSIVDELINQQKLTSNELDRPLWSEGSRRLISWPPETRAVEALDQRQPQAAKLIGRIVGDAKGVLRPQESRGFVFKYDKADLSDADIAKLPPKIFGFDLAAEARGEERARLAEACGSVESRDEAGGNCAIRPGTLIDTGIDGRLGPILVNEYGDHYSLTASHIVPSLREPLKVLDKQHRNIGIVEACPEDNMLRGLGVTLIRLLPGIQLEPEYCGFDQIGEPIDDRRIFAKSAIMTRLGGGVSTGYVSGTGVAITFKDPGGSAFTTIREAIEIRSRDPSAPFSDRGDSGAPVVNDRGELLGILLARDEHHSFVAPVASILQRLGLRPIQRATLSAGVDAPADVVGEIYGVARRLYARANRHDQDLGWTDLGDETPNEEERLEAESEELAARQAEEV